MGSEEYFWFKIERFLFTNLDPILTRFEIGIDADTVAEFGDIWCSGVSMLIQQFFFIFNAFVMCLALIIPSRYLVAHRQYIYCTDTIYSQQSSHVYVPTQSLRAAVILYNLLPFASESTLFSTRPSPKI